MLDSSVVSRIQSGEIVSRRQLYRTGVVRTPELIRWLDQQGLLVRRSWSKQEFDQALRSVHARTGQMPKAADDWNLVRLSKRFYGSWNSALFSVFGTVGQHRYNLDKELCVGLVRSFVEKHHRFPMRSEFDGSTAERPYYESVLNALGTKKWRDVLSQVDLHGLPCYAGKHGFGKVRIHAGYTFLSHQEYLIGKYLLAQGLTFEQEVPYGPDSSYRFDFFVPVLNLYIEYYGIATEEYLARVEQKRAAYLGRDVLEIFKHDNTVSKLSSKVQRL